MKPPSDDRELLEQLLIAWRATRDPRTENAIARLGRLIASTRTPFDARTSEQRWHEVAARGDPADLDWVLEVDWLTAESKVVYKRVASLAAFPSDPRLAYKICAILELHSRSDRGFARAVERILVASATPSLQPSYDKLGNKAAAKAAREITVQAPDPDLLSCARLRIGDGDALSALWAAHAADPADLTHRAVLADALQLAHDPRGELIQLQLAIADGCAGPEAHARAAFLLGAYQVEWMGPLPGIDHRASRFGRGFPVRLVSRASSEELMHHRDRVEWLTTEELVLTSRMTSSIKLLLDRMRSLRRLVLEPHTASDLVHVLGDAAYPEILVLGIRNGVPSRERFPQLRVLVIEFYGLSVAEILHTLARAAELDIDVTICDLSYAEAGITMSQLIAARANGPRELRLRCFRREFDDPHEWVAVRREDDVADLVEFPSYRVVQVVPMLVRAGIRRVRVHFRYEPEAYYVKPLDEVFAAARKQGVVIERLTEGRSIMSPAS